MGRISEAAKKKTSAPVEKVTTDQMIPARLKKGQKPEPEEIDEDDELDGETEDAEESEDAEDASEEDGDEGDDIEDDEVEEDDGEESEFDEEEDSADEDEEESEDFLGDDEDDDEDDLTGATGKSKDPGSFEAKRKKVMLDFTDSGDAPPSVAPGNYPARVQDVELKDSASGNPMLEWTFKITAGKEKNRDLKFWSSMKQDARWASARVLKALGVPVAGKRFELDPVKIIGKPCILNIVHDGRNEDFPHKVQKVLPADAAAIKASKAAKDLI